MITTVTPYVLPQSLDVVVGTWPDPHKDTSIPVVRSPTLRPRGLTGAALGDSTAIIP